MSICTGNHEEHCCWINGKVCSYLEENTVPGRRWACGLLVRLGSWEAVTKSPEWQRDVKPLCDRLGLDSCEDFPRKDKICLACGVVG